MTLLHLLIIDDSEDDALLIVTHLRRGGIELDYERVQTADGVARALASRPPDVVICDYSLPSFTARDALTVALASGQDIPFIVVSGAVGEEVAASLMQAGAHDVILKDRLPRLVPAVQRELRDAQARKHRRHAEAALRQSEDRFRLLAEYVRDVIFRYQLDSQQLEYISPAVNDLIGYSPEELYADPGLIFGSVEPQDREAFVASWKSPATEPLVLRWRHRNGELAWVEQRAVGIPAADGQIVAVEGMLRDITPQMLADQERARLDLQLRQAERLDSLGRLAGGVAHDFNNILAAIMAYVYDINSTLPADHPCRSDVENIGAAAERAAALSRQLLIFGRLQPSEPATLHLNTIIADLEQLLRRTIGEDIELQIMLQSDLHPVTVDRSKIEQVIMNLVVNARGAMPDGGRLRIDTVNVGPDRELRTSLDGPEEWVRMTVTDTGTGMSDEVAQRAFEPFFTTKGPGQGTGLGLATAYGVITEADGDISLRSELGAGTTVTVQLPAASQPVTVPDTEHAAPLQGGGQSILVVEDDDAVREVISRILTKAGYHVLATATPKEAVELCSNPMLHIDVLLSDVVMPEMSGPQMVEKIHAVRPNLPTLLMSGYTAGATLNTPDTVGDLPLLRKPFSTANLLQRIHDLLA